MNTETTTVVCLYFPFLKDGDFELSDSEDGHKFAEIEISIKESGKSYYGCQGVKLHNSKEFWTQINFKISKRLFEKYQMKPIISKNLTPLPPFPTREWGFQSLSPRRGEVWRGVNLYIQNFSNTL